MRMRWPSHLLLLQQLLIHSAVCSCQALHQGCFFLWQSLTQKELPQTR